MAEDIDLTPDGLAPNPDEPPGRVLIGILGESANPENVLLYLDLALQKRYEIPKDAILARQNLPAAQSPLGVDASAIRVRADAALRLQLDQPRQVEDEFLAGDFTAPGSFTPTEAVPPIQLPTGFGWGPSGVHGCHSAMCPLYSWHYCLSHRWCP
jgi:hypothetical protein